MKIYRNGVEIELTAEEIRHAHDEYTKYCRVEDIVDKVHEKYGFVLDRNEDKKLLNFVIERADKMLSNNDDYYERFWDSVEAAIDEYKESIVLAQKPLTPSEFLFVATGDIYPEIKDLDHLLNALNCFELDLWDYPVDEIDEALEHNDYVILVEFLDGSKRIFEANEEMMEKYKTVIYEVAEKNKFSLEDKISEASQKSLLSYSNNDDRDNIKDYETLSYKH